MSIPDIDFNETPRVVLTIGKPKKGKSNCIKYWILKNTIQNKVFKFGIVFSRTGGLGNEYDYLPQDYIHRGYDESVLANYISILEEEIAKKNKPTPNFVVFDDLLGLLNKQDKFLMNFLAIHRHLGCTVFMAFQHLNFGTSTTMREICSHAVLFSSKSYNTINSVYENFGTLFDSYKDFKNFFIHITSQPYTGMLYIQDSDDIDNNYFLYRAPDMSEVKYQIQY